MKPFKTSYDEKTPAFEIDHAHILKDQASQYAESLIIKQCQVAVQVAFPKEVKVESSKAVEDAMEKRAKKLAEEAHEQVDKLHEKLLKLKKEEEVGNDKAADEADKEVKATKKQLQKVVDEFGSEMREAVEKALKDQSNPKVKARSASRSVLRGFDLNEDFFDSETSSSEPSPYLTKLSAELAKSGKELAKLTQDEGAMRTKLAQQIAQVQQIVEKSRVNKAEVDLEAFLKANSNTKEVNELVPAAQKYVDFVNTMQEKIEDVYSNLDKVYELVRGSGAEDLKNEKLVEHEVEEYGEALNNVSGTIDDKLAAGKAVQRLFKDDYKDGQRWKSLIATLEGIKAAAKSGRVLQDSGAKLDKALKA